MSLIPAITDVPPEEIREELALLCTALDKDVPAKIPDRNLLIATWNLRGFGDLTESWKCQENYIHINHLILVLSLLTYR